MWGVLLGLLLAGGAAVLERFATLAMWVGAVVTLVGGVAYLVFGAPVSWVAVPGGLTAVTSLVRLRLVAAGFGPPTLVRTMSDGRRE